MRKRFDSFSFAEVAMQYRFSPVTFLSETERYTVAERDENKNGFKDFRTEKGSRQGQNLALTGLCVPSLLDSG